jgi:hypothetical protein
VESGGCSREGPPDLIPPLEAEQDGVSAALGGLQKLLSGPDLGFHAIGTVADDTVAVKTSFCQWRNGEHAAVLACLMLKCLPAGRKPLSARSPVISSNVSTVTSSSLGRK